MYKTLFESLAYILFVNNCFSNAKLFKILCFLEISGCGTANKDFGFSKEQLAFRNVDNKQNNRSLQAYMVVGRVFLSKLN